MALVDKTPLSEEQWRVAYGLSPEREGSFTTMSGEPVKPLYTERDLPEGIGGDDDPIALPGQFPFTRGVYPSMYRGRLWTMRQFAGFGTAAETNERFRYLLDHGQTGLSTAFDMPSLMGMTPIIRSLWVRSGARGSRSTRSLTWSVCFRGSLWGMSRSR